MKPEGFMVPYSEPDFLFPLCNCDQIKWFTPWTKPSMQLQLPAVMVHTHQLGCAAIPVWKPFRLPRMLSASPSLCDVFFLLLGFVVLHFAPTWLSWLGRNRPVLASVLHEETGRTLLQQTARHMEWKRKAATGVNRLHSLPICCHLFQVKA